MPLPHALVQRNLGRTGGAMISHDRIAAWAAGDDFDTQELKPTAAQRREATRSLRTLCAMPEHRGGRVLFRIVPDARGVGQQEVAEQTVDDLAQEPGDIDPAVLAAIDPARVGRRSRGARRERAAALPHPVRVPPAQDHRDVSRGIRERAEPAVRGGQPEPEREETAAVVAVGFRSTGRHRGALARLAEASGGLPVREIAAALGEREQAWRILEDLATLNARALVQPKGWGRGARWELAGR